VGTTATIYGSELETQKRRGGERRACKVSCNVGEKRNAEGLAGAEWVREVQEVNSAYRDRRARTGQSPFQRSRTEGTNENKLFGVRAKEEGEEIG